MKMQRPLLLCLKICIKVCEVSEDAGAAIDMEWGCLFDVERNTEEGLHDGVECDAKVFGCSHGILCDSCDVVTMVQRDLHVDAVRSAITTV